MIYFRIFSIIISLLLIPPAAAQDVNELRKRRTTQTQEDKTTQNQLKPSLEKYEVPGPLPDLKDDGCSKNPMLRNKKQTIDYDLRDTKESFKFPDAKPIAIFSDIERVTVKNETLEISFSSKGKFHEFIGPVNDVIQLTKYEASPGTAVIAHTLTLGIGLLLNPGNSVQHALGCTDRKIIRREVAGKDSKATGSYQYLDYESTIQVSVTGIGAPRIISGSIDPRTNRNTISIDLKDAILSNDISYPHEISIQCTNCLAFSNAERTDQASSVPRKIVVDFSQYRAEEFARLRKIEEERQKEREKLAQQAAAIEAFTTSLIGRWSPIDECIRDRSPNKGLIFHKTGTGDLALRYITSSPSAATQEHHKADLAKIAATVQSEKIFNMQVDLIFNDPQRIVSRRLDIAISDETLSISNVRDSINHLRFRQEVFQAWRTGGDLVSCNHPKVLQAIAKFDREEAERNRQLQAAAEQRRRQAEKELQDRRRAEADKQREEADKRRKQEERDRFYKM